MFFLNNIRFQPRRFNKGRGAALLVILLNLLLLPLEALPALAAEPQFVKIQGDQFYLNGQRSLIKGSNYYQRNAPWAEMWKQWYGPQVEQEIAEGTNKLGLNSLRLLVPYGETHGWNIDATGEVNVRYLNELQQMVQIAGKHGLRVILTLFDFYDEWPGADTPGEAANLRYLTTLVNTFRDDDRVLAWDLHNEPDNYNRWQKYKRPEEVIDWLARMTTATRRLDPNHPITIGLGDYRNHWLKARADLPQLLDLVDFVSFHAYEAPNLLSQTQELKAKTTKPIVLEETGWPTAPAFISRTYNEQDQLWFYQRLVEVMQNEKLAGATQWLLWDLTAGRRLRPTDIADWMGLIRWNGTLKPAGEVYATVSAPRLPATVSSDLPLNGIPLEEAEKPLYFPETNHYVASYFKQLLLQQGGVDIFGLPLTEPFTENAHTIQFFERAVMELWLEGREEPGYNNLPRDEQLRRLVKLRLLGRDIAAQRHFDKSAPFQSDDQRWYFPETGHSLSYGFLYYWQHHGGLLTLGYPISEELEEISATDGQKHTVQYFERVRFEYHPEHKGTPYETQLGQLGREEMKRRGWPSS